LDNAINLIFDIKKGDVFMKKFGVSVPIAGYVYIEVEAENKNEAIEKVFEQGYKEDDIQEMDMYEKIVEGNICNVWHNEVEVEELENDEEK
jgi:hypothetical protein